MLELPVSTSALKEYLPHRPPMIWVDEIVSADETSGEGRVRWNPSALYCTAGKTRPSAAIEFAAQTFGYSRVVWLMRSTPEASHLCRRAFLVGVRDFEWSGELASEAFLVRVEGIRVLGPLTLFRTEVRSAEGALLANGHLKVFSE